jgi:hypothetical protein
LWQRCMPHVLPGSEPLLDCCKKLHSVMESCEQGKVVSYRMYMLLCWDKAGFRFSHKHIAMKLQYHLKQLHVQSQLNSAHIFTT